MIGIPPRHFPDAPVTDAPVEQPLPPRPQPGRLGQAATNVGRRAFHVFNRWVSVPLLRAGMGPWMGTPIGGWILLLRVRGRRTGLTRFVPLSYLIADGSAWVMAGFGPHTDWYRNVLAQPEVDVLLPGRARLCRAAQVLDPAIRRRIIPALTRATGLPGYMIGCDPYRASDDEILAATAWVPLVRLQPVGEPLVSGPDDPGGFGWVWRQAVVMVVMVQVFRLLRRRG